MPYKQLQRPNTFVCIQVDVWDRRLRDLIKQQQEAGATPCWDACLTLCILQQQEAGVTPCWKTCNIAKHSALGFGLTTDFTQQLLTI